ncbi:hypothetical protein BX666DRAFT_2029824 [Dichotomocladium elegans]|nr:hypothetical protein BX666DRAFT_2029824 [Dichotomocladium elegans]
MVVQDAAQQRLQTRALDNESGYNEKKGIFRDLGMRVNEQESGIQSIYGNVLNIAQSTRQTADELIIANGHQKSVRKNM